MADAQRAHSDLAEQRLVRGFSLGLPLVTIGGAVVVGVIVGPATSILVLTAGLLLGVIAILWNSIRILSGDASLAPEIEALDMAAQGVDALAGRKKMLLRALKDLDNERSIGKLDDDDYEQISANYRAELKALLLRIDESLEPHRARAEEATRAHLAKVGLVEAPPQEKSPEASVAKTGPKTDARVVCPKCKASNEPDAKFCKGCAKTLGDEPSTTEDHTTDAEEPADAS